MSTYASYSQSTDKLVNLNILTFIVDDKTWHHYKELDV